MNNSLKQNIELEGVLLVLHININIDLYCYLIELFCENCLAE